MHTGLMSSTCFAALFAIGSSAFAQGNSTTSTNPEVNAPTAGAPIAAAAGQVTDASSGLDDIVVTAQRREESLQRAALAISAVGGDTLTQQSITQATDITRLVPALQIAPASAFTQIYLRGIGTFGANAFAEQGVSFNLDGVYLSRPAAPAGLFYDLERLEVLKGPQGTLYGRNATGGAVNVITVKPKVGELGGFASAEYGNYDALKGSAAINIPIGDAVAVRVSGQYAKHDGYFSDGYDDEDTKAVRAQIRAKSGAIDVNLSLDYADVGGQGSGGTIVPLLFGKGDRRLGPSDPAVLAAYRLRTPGFPVPQITARSDGYQDNKFYGAALTANVDLGFAKLTVIPAYRKTDLDFVSYASSFMIDVTEKSHQTSLETRLANQSDRLNWVVGAYYFKESVDADQLFDQASNATIINSALDTRSYAAFGQATYSFADNFRVTGGLRYTSDKKEQDSTSIARPFVGFVPPGPPAFTPIFLNIPSAATTDVKFNKTTYKAGVEYDVAPASLLYASIATGFKSGILYSAVGQNYSNPENLTAYTFGSKNRFLDNRLQVNVEAFYWDYKDQQISHLGPVQVATTPGGPIFGPVFLTENAGRAKLYGTEIELLFKITPRDLFSANVQYLHTKYDELQYQAYSTSGAAPAVGCAVTPTTQVGTAPTASIYDVDCSGRPLPNAPRWTLNLGYEHTLPLSGRGRLVFGADTRIESSRFLSVDYLSDGKQGSYMMSNARLTYETENGRFGVTGFVNNLENELVYSNSLQSPVKNGTLYNQLRPPRTYGIRGTVKF